MMERDDGDTRDAEDGEVGDRRNMMTGGRVPRRLAQLVAGPAGGGGGRTSDDVAPGKSCAAYVAQEGSPPVITSGTW